MARFITAQELRRHWVDRLEVALIDVREEGPYSLSHPFFAITVPVSEVEVKLPPLVPRLSTLVVVYDDGEGYVERAVERVQVLGYENIAILKGGLSAYALVGEVFRDVNVPSKAFGELVESIRHTPSLSATEVKEILDKEGDKKEKVVVLDARRFSEHHTMSIPHSLSCPGGELLYRVLEAAPSPDTKVLVHCAGRTRSIIGTQSLVNSGLPNKVFAIRNGTIGWTLADLDLEHGQSERVPVPSDATKLDKAREYARTWADHVGVTVINHDKLLQLASERENRTLHLLDVRDPEEYAAGHLQGFVSAPGGQLVQATDEWVGVRGARIVLYDSDGVRARMTASWLVQLGWEVYVLDGETGTGQLPDLDLKLPVWSEPVSGSITVEEFRNLSKVVVIDLARSPEYKKGHISGAWNVSGPELGRDLKVILASSSADTTIVLVSPDGRIAAANFEVARQAVEKLSSSSPRQRVVFLAGGTSAWAAASDTSLETAKEGSRWAYEPIDVYKRPYEGTDNDREKMQGYLDWEYGLIAQVANDGVANFHVVRERQSLS